MLFLYSEKQTNCKTTTGQKFRRGQKFRLTPDSDHLWSVSTDIVHECVLTQTGMEKYSVAK